MVPHKVQNVWFVEFRNTCRGSSEHSKSRIWNLVNMNMRPQNVWLIAESTIRSELHFLCEIAFSDAKKKQNFIGWPPKCIIVHYCSLKTGRKKCNFNLLLIIDNWIAQANHTDQNFKIWSIYLVFCTWNIFCTFPFSLVSAPSSPEQNGNILMNLWRRQITKT